MLSFLGVPAHIRGEVWLFLYEQWKFRQKCCPTVNADFTFPDVTYNSLLKELTSHQHAILIDLGESILSEFILGEFILSEFILGESILGEVILGESIFYEVHLDKPLLSDPLEICAEIPI